MEKQQYFSKVDEVKLDKNVDRIINYGDKENQYLVASYHLDKEAGTKSGQLVLVQVKDKHINLLNKSEEDFYYGILSIKQEDKDNYSLGCSDGSIKILDVKDDGEILKVNEKSTYEYGDTVCLMHDSSKSIVCGGYQNGSVIAFDKQTQQQILTLEKHHQFEVWYVHLYADSILYSCSDDFTYKAVDLQSQTTMYSCKRHEAGVTWLLKYSDQRLMTGSYDGTIRIWDERNMKSDVESLNLAGKSVWDVKFDQSKFQIGVAAIYDGYLFSRPKDPSMNIESLISPNFSLNAFEFEQYTGHESICYAFEYIPNTNMILTSSFYDSTLQLIEYNY